MLGRTAKQLRNQNQLIYSSRLAFSTAESTAPKRDHLSSALTPQQVVEQLNKYIIGQQDAKKAVSIALRNRWRRHQLNDEFKNEVIPKNILMIGPTGCGKTEIARRIAKLSQAPFIKVEATKFTEVGFHGKDVDSIIKDLVEISINITKKRIREEIKGGLGSIVEEIILDRLLGTDATQEDRDFMRELLRNGAKEDSMITLDSEKANFEGDGGNLLAALMGNIDNKKPKRRKRVMKVSEARILLEEQEIEKKLNDYDVNKEAITAVEQNGIVFIDEIDKIVSSGDQHRGADASAEGVQRDLLPLIEGTSIATKYGSVNTDFILFIASGAFHSNKPSDLLAELQGRLPIRVTLKGLTEEDLYRILTEPVTNLVKQQVELIKTENLELEFTNDAIKEIARVAFMTNKTVENIGARRLHTIIERVMENISFEAPDITGKRVEISADYVKRQVKDLVDNTDLRKYIL